MALKMIGGICLLVFCVSTISAADDSTIANGQNSGQNSAASPGLRSILRIYDECQRAEGGIAMCLKKKAITFIDRVERIDVINVGDGVKVIGLENAPMKTGRSMSENELDQMLPRAFEDRDTTLNTMLADKLANYISGRKIQISLPQVTPNELGRGMEEGELLCFELFCFRPNSDRIENSAKYRF